MLGGVGNEIFDAAHDVIEQDIAINESAEAGYLASDGGPDFGLGILEHLDEGRDEVSGKNLIVDSLGNLFQNVKTNASCWTAKF